MVKHNPHSVFEVKYGARSQVQLSCNDLKYQHFSYADKHWVCEGLSGKLEMDVNWQFLSIPNNCHRL